MNEQEPGFKISLIAAPITDLKLKLTKRNISM